MKLGRTARFYRKNKASRDKKKAYDTKYHSTPNRKKYRAYLNKIRRQRKLKGNPNDLSHKKDGGVVLESRKRNRARNGSGNKSTLK